MSIFENILRESYADTRKEWETARGTYRSNAKQLKLELKDIEKLLDKGDRQGGWTVYEIKQFEDAFRSIIAEYLPSARITKISSKDVVGDRKSPVRALKRDSWYGEPGYRLHDFAEGGFEIDCLFGKSNIHIVIKVNLENRLIKISNFSGNEGISNREYAQCYTAIADFEDKINSEEGFSEFKTKISQIDDPIGKYFEEDGNHIIGKGMPSALKYKNSQYDLEKLQHKASREYTEENVRAGATGIWDSKSGEKTVFIEEDPVEQDGKLWVKVSTSKGAKRRIPVDEITIPSNDDWSRD